ncbi:MAG: peptidoglycan DD-metalloendopeptidase family protein [Rikenellaceae bacterium]|jgi:murein DD-endopeptidase MepM/ murein hydrolase activator NlpD|nr:peptidoglycan DD-metalloendopeptidase family protein [Rikenellaceae bacterium]
MIVGADGVSRPLTGYEIGSPGAPLEFTVLEIQHVKFVWMSPRTGEMLMLPLSVIQSSFRYPCDGAVISAYGPRSGSMHTGVDLKAHPGDTIRAALDGIVRMSKEYGGYGNLVVVRHLCGIETLYGHNTRNLVAVNQYVRAGQAIALAGRTGRATTEHCHFEVLAAGRPFDPGLVLDFPARKVKSDTIYIFNKGEDLLVYNAQSTRGLLAEKPALAQPAASPVSTPATTAKPAPEGEGEWCTIKKGEGLYRIAVAHATTVARLCELNGIENEDDVKAGQRIRVK